MKFFMYWLIAILCSGWAILEKGISLIQHSSMLPFYGLITLAVFFWLSAYGTRLEEKKVNPDDNPF